MGGRRAGRWKRLAALQGRKAALDARRPLPPAAAASLLAALRIERTCASNAIEGHSLTLQETRVLLEGITVGGKPLRDHLEAIDHAEAFDYVESRVDPRHHGPNMSCGRSMP